MGKRILLVGLVGLIIMFSCLSVLAEEGEKLPGETSPVVEDGTLVKIHYTLTVEDKIVDSSKGQEPMEFQVGSKKVIPGFEKALLGMEIGEKKTFKINPDEGYGRENPEGVKEILKDKLPPDVQPEAGMTLYAKGPNRKPHPVRIVEVKKDTIILNFNHPLAGKTLNFDVEVMSIN
jgi:FKBP-type peptidyl-prolyl cis-trans isomerase 2